MGMQHNYPEGTIIINEKGMHQLMYVVLKGTIALYINYKQEDEYLLGLCTKGTTFGELGILCHSPSMYTAVAESDAIVVTFSESELGTFIERYPSQALGVMRNTARINKILSLNLKMALNDSQKELDMIKSMSVALHDKELKDVEKEVAEIEGIEEISGISNISDIIDQVENIPDIKPEENASDAQATENDNISSDTQASETNDDSTNIEANNREKWHSSKKK